MKKSIILIAIVFFGITLKSFAQDVEEPDNYQEKKNHFYLSVELLKTIPWLMIDNAYIIEPQLEYRSKSLVLSLQYGLNDIKNIIYNRMEYRNQGTYYKIGAGIDFSYFKNNDDRNNIILGGNLIFSSYKETGVVVFENPYFGNAELIQENDSRGIEVYFTYRRVFENNFFVNVTPRIAYVITDYDEPLFPVYYASGYGVVNVFENNTSNLNFTIGASLKVGYRF
ncbi:MAG: DUF6048 family protein [Cyclobacteriaceae bacterium]|nr:DUF6048 family protein [Cyclobacteriaceae bacterium]